MHQRGREGAAVAQLCSPVPMAAIVYILPFLKPSSCSPYLKFGCLSPRLFHAKLQQVRGWSWVEQLLQPRVRNLHTCLAPPARRPQIYSERSGKHTQPPVSLRGQLLWREFFYTVS